MDTNNVNPAISLIIPVYNVEKYLRKALTSVVNQSFKDVEVIIVNDGSTDESLNIIKEFEKSYNNFIVINQPNKGLAEARNTGIRNAKGKYIAFMDSDDFIDCTFLETLYNMAEKNNADMAYCNHYLYYPLFKLNIYMPFTTRAGVYDKEKALNKLIKDIMLHHYAWNKLYKKTLFEDNNIEFYDMCFEDISTSPRLLYSSNKVVITNKSLYHYTKRVGSILNTMNASKINDYTRALGCIRNFLEGENDYKEYKISFLIASIRVIIVNWYSIFRMHLEFMNFSGFQQNCINVVKEIKAFLEEEYIVSNGIISLKWPVKEPKKRSKKDAELDPVTNKD